MIDKRVFAHFLLGPVPFAVPFCKIWRIRNTSVVSLRGIFYSFLKAKTSLILPFQGLLLFKVILWPVLYYACNYHLHHRSSLSFRTTLNTLSLNQQASKIDLVSLGFLKSGKWKNNAAAVFVCTAAAAATLFIGRPSSSPAATLRVLCLFYIFLLLSLYDGPMFQYTLKHQS